MTTTTEFSGGTLTVTNSTLVNNRATDATGGIRINGTATVHLRNTVVAGSTGVRRPVKGQGQQIPRLRAHRIGLSDPAAGGGRLPACNTPVAATGVPAAVYIRAFDPSQSTDRGRGKVAVRNQRGLYRLQQPDTGYQ